MIASKLLGIFLEMQDLGVYLRSTESESVFQQDLLGNFNVHKSQRKTVLQISGKIT